MAPVLLETTPVETHNVYKKKNKAFTNTAPLLPLHPKFLTQKKSVTQHTHKYLYKKKQIFIFAKSRRQYSA